MRVRYEILLLLVGAFRAWALKTPPVEKVGIISRLQSIDGILQTRIQKLIKSRPPELGNINNDAEKVEVGLIGRLRGIDDVNLPIQVQNLIASRQKGIDTQMRSPVEASVLLNKDWKDVNRLELLPYAGSLFFGLSMSVVLKSALPLEMATGAEVAFAAYCFGLVSTTFQKPAELVPMPNYDREWLPLWEDVFDSLPDVSRWLEEWFLDGKIEDITLDDAEEFMAWAMYSTTVSYVSERQRDELDKSVKFLEKRCNTVFQRRDRDSGKPKVRSMRSTIEPLQWFHKPLIFYILTQGLTSQALNTQFKGFIKKKVNGLTYWCGDGKNSRGELISYQGKTPVVFYHGVGGLVYYVSFLKGLEDRGIPIVAVEMPYVSLHIAPDVPSIADHVSGYQHILDELGADKAIVVGHSWGTNVISWLCQSADDRVSAAIFLDPVVFMLHLRDITYSWFYEDTASVTSRKYPDAAKDEKGIVDGENPDTSPTSAEDLTRGLMGLIKSEVFTNHALQRPYFWFRNILFPHEMEKKPFPTVICVSELDPIVPSAAVQEQLLNHRKSLKENGLGSKVEIKVLPGATHGSFVFERDYQRSVLDLIEETYVKVTQ
jgi:pimeloyl-ACP methyl ester carboxylesterase